MKNITHRRGTALIIVIAILIMLAIMATAYISAARIDRQGVSGTGGSSMITQTDPLKVQDKMTMLMSNLSATVQANLVRDVFRNLGNNIYRQPQDNNLDMEYDGIGHYDSMLSDRLPVPNDAPTNLVPAWPSTGDELGVVSSSSVTFASPSLGFDNARHDPYPIHVLPSSIRVTYSNIGALPTSLQSTLGNRTRVFPAFHVPGDDAGGALPSGRRFIVADTDGDGIADALLQKVTDTSGDFAPQAYPGGGTVTYWVAYRIVDNNSAINVNTALDMRGDPVFNPTGNKLQGDITTSFNPLDPTNPAHPNYGYFRSNIGLRQLLWIASDDLTAASPNSTIDPDTAEMQQQLLKLLEWRTQDMAFNVSAYYSALRDDHTPFPSGDYQFLTLGESLEFQLARRLENPGVIGFDSADTADPYKLARALDSSDSASMAYNFVFRPASSSRSNSEAIFDRNLLKWSPNYAAVDTKNILPYYPADQAALWWQWNFNADYTSRMGELSAQTGYVALPDTVIDTNGYPQTDTSNYPQTATDPIRHMDTLPLRTMLTTYNPVSSYAPNAQVALNSLTGELLGNIDAIGLDFMPSAALLPWVRVSANTGSFGQLWRSYFAVMANASGGLPSGNSGHDVTERTNIFHSVIRNDDTVATPLNDKDMLLLRSALAAVNTVDLRDHADPRPTVKTFTLTTNPSTSFARKVRVYGNKPQVYITEVVAFTGGNSPNDDLITIELYNPTLDDITLTGWQLAARTGQTMTVIAQDALNTVTIPAGQYFVLTSDDGGASLHTVYGITLPLGITPTTYLSVPTLIDALGKELVIVRPSSDGSTELTRMAPVDQFDFFDVDVTNTTNPAGMPRTYHYARSTASIWDCVYPGRWRPVDNVTPYTTGYDEQHVAAVEPDSAALAPVSPISEIGTTSATTITNGIYTIPVNLKGWPGPNENTASLRFPFGGFARDGDLLKVPFIGAYTIYEYDASGAEPAVLPVVEINGLPMDSQFAVNTNAGSGQFVGRFCPQGDRGTASDPYNFSHKLFDHLTANDSPVMDFLPNVDSTKLADPVRMAVANSTLTANSPDEAAIGVQGKININTAPWQVLATLPLVMNTDGTVDVPNSVVMAKAIVAYRDSHGPFASIFDLRFMNPNNTTDFANFMDPGGRISTAPDNLYAFGDNRATGVSDTTNVPVELDRQYIQLIRLSNLITTRSDTFTVYLQVQAWLNAETDQPVLLDERRMSYIVDRSMLGKPDGTSFKNQSSDLKLISISTN